MQYNNICDDDREFTNDTTDNNVYNKSSQEIALFIVLNCIRNTPNFD